MLANIVSLADRLTKKYGQNNQNPMQNALAQYRNNMTQSTQPMNYGDATNRIVSGLENRMSAAAPRVNVPTPYQGFNPSTSPEYQAALREAQRNVQQAQGNTLAQLQARGQGNSSYSETLAHQLAQKEFGRVSDTVLPQLAAQDYARHRDGVADRFRVDDTNYGRSQDQMRNLSSLASMLAGLDQQRFDRGIQEGQLTGYYMPGQSRELLNQLFSLKAAAENPNITADQLASYRAQGDQIRTQLAGMGIDPNLISADVTSAQARQNASGFGTPTMQMQQFQEGIRQDERDFGFRQEQFAYQQLRDQIGDQQYQQKFDEDARRFGLQFAADEAYRNRQISLQERNHALSAARMNLDMQERSDRQRQTEDLRGFQADIMDGLGAFDSVEDALGWLQANAREITSQLGADGYQDILRFARSYYGGGEDQSAIASARNKAVSEAAKDPRWYNANEQDREQMIQEYMRYYLGQ